MDWWVGIQNGSADLEELSGPSKAYEEFFNDLSEHLPRSIADFHRAISLHDGRLINVTVNMPQRMLMLAVEMANGRTVGLLYLGLRGYEIEADDPRSLPGPAKFGDIGYTEFSLGEEGEFVHSWIFSSGIEMTIVAENFAWDTMQIG